MLMERRTAFRCLQKSERGFSMIELAIALSIILIVTATAIFQLDASLRQSKANVALQTTLGQLRRAQEMAIDQRRVYRVSFISPRTIQLDQVNIDPVTLAKTFVFQSQIDLPIDTQFTVVSGIPTSPTTVPDGYGSGSVAIDFDRDFGGGGTEVYFQRDGRSLDSANRLNNGVIYMCRPGDLMSCKAVSLIGATGRSKGWRLTKTSTSTRWSQ
jgi:prepilin-type N-terminal cleavage/methylation domain-containing protein